MQILEGKDVDVITPFPANMIASATQWARCYKTMVMDDNGPQTNDEIAVFLQKRFSQPNMQSFGIVDKNNLTHTKESDVPLVGVVLIERVSPENAYAHVLSHRRAWGKKLAQPGLIEQGARIVLEHTFKAAPELMRLNAVILENNYPARNFVHRIGFKLDGCFSNYVHVAKQPASIVHYGYLRPTGEETH